MNELRYGGNLFLLPDGPEAAVVTTNGIIRKDGLAVMGAGIAKYARDNLAGIDAVLGSMLTKYGNHAYFLGSFTDMHRQIKSLAPSIFVVSMPTKNDWRDPSDINLIKQSAHELMALANRNNLRKLYLPAPGCSNGRLDYISDVRPTISGILDNRFTVCLDPALYDRIHRNGGAV